MKGLLSIFKSFLSNLAEWSLKILTFINLFGSGLAHLISIIWVRILDLQSSTRHHNKTISPNTISCIVHSVVDVVRDE